MVKEQDAKLTLLPLEQSFIHLTGLIVLVKSTLASYSHQIYRGRLQQSETACTIMSNPIVRYAIARENGFFKVEQVIYTQQRMLL